MPSWNAGTLSFGGSRATISYVIEWRQTGDHAIGELHGKRQLLEQASVSQRPITLALSDKREITIKLIFRDGVWRFETVGYGAARMAPEARV